MLIFQDVTEHKRVELELHQLYEISQRQAQQAKLLNQIVHTISHQPAAVRHFAANGDQRFRSVSSQSLRYSLGVTVGRPLY